ncbi:hypothetical protein LOZ58_005619 [Ophidiomyces ophidiicola]|nr:hypothetical protein LOZ58_005619 [Ophidiomyces ophidiicola]
MANMELVDLEKELTCSICTELLYQPLTLLDCLHTFCGCCLKEWFSWQQLHPNSGRSPQFTCPSCRSVVRDTKHDAKVTTLLDLFLRSHPDKEKSIDEKAEIAKNYKRGDDVLPVERNPARTSRSDEEEEEDRRLMEEVRELSLRDSHERGRYRDSRLFNSRTHRGADQPSDQQRVEDARRRRRAARQTSTTTRSRSPLDRSADRSRQVEHQASLRSLLSNPDFTETAIQEEILRQIAEEGLLDGIDLQSLNPEQEEELTERIAEAFRRRQRHRTRSHGESSGAEGTSSRQPRSRSHSTGDRHTTQVGSSQNSRRHLLESRGTASASHRRNASDRGIGRRRTSPIPGSLEGSITPARRSATDVSEHSRDSRSRPRTHASSRSGAASVGDQTGRLHVRQHRGSSRSDQRSLPDRHSSDSPTIVNSPVSDTFQPTSPRTSNSSTEQSRHRSDSRSRSNNIPNRSVVPSFVTPSPQSELYSRTSIPSFVEPSISCERCHQKNLEYELHKICTLCKDGAYCLCLGCYRRELGCLRWFGFGKAAQTRFEKSLEPSSTEQEKREGPHRLRSRRYIPPAEETILSVSRENERQTTSSDPSTRLQDGLFCDICHSFSDDCFWKCSQCNEGEWGFCSSCVGRGKCCTHPLLPITRVDEATGNSRHSIPASSRNSACVLVPGSSLVVERRRYGILSFSTKCNICAYPIPPSVTRYHCPTCEDGDYDICTNCYLKLGATGRISRDNGRNGWRRCPHNHRMIIVGFEDHEEGQKRVVVKGLVGGYAWKDDFGPTISNNSGTNRSESASPHSPLSRQDSDPWEWPEGANPDAQVKGSRRKLNRSRHHISAGSAETPKNPLTMRFPPSGGIGLRLIALWSYYPEPEETDEIMFPRGAEITEAENINDDWLWGCYAGQKGLFPGNYASVVEEIGMV